MKTPEKVVNHIVEWLKDYLKNSNMKGFVVGVSGGIDSAVTSTLCSLTNAPVLCLEMEIHQDPNQVSRALQHIDWLENKFENVSHHKFSLTGVFDEFVKGLTRYPNEGGAIAEFSQYQSKTKNDHLVLFCCITSLSGSRNR